MGHEMTNEMTLPADLSQIVLQKTREGRLKWEELDRNSYFAQLDENGVIIERRPGGIGPYSYSLRFVNESRTEIGRLSSEDLAVSVEGMIILEEIYDKARRQVLRVDETLANIRRKLESL
jgi:hypothetical protein